MNVNLEKLENSRVRLTVEADAAKLEEGLAHAYRTVNRQIAIPGFRKGKAPRSIVERYYGVSIFFEDALDYLVPQLYEAAVKETGITPVDQPELDLEKIEPGEGLSLVFEVDVYPEIELGQYKGLSVEKRVRKVDKADVDRELEQLRMQHSELIAVDSRDDVQEGDFANIDFKGYLDGKPFSGGAAAGYTLEIGSGQFIPGFEEQLIGMKVGEEKDINVTFPEQYHSEELAGKEVTFNVKINGLKERSLPELDDEFAKDLGEYETLAELRDSIRERLEASLTRVTKEEMENKLIEQIIENSTINLPRSMIQGQVETMFNNFRFNLMYSGMTLEQYLEFTNQTEEELQKEMEPEAIRQLKRSLILDEVAEQEGISVSDEEIERKIDEMVEESSDPEQTRQNWENSRDRLTTMIKIDKTWDFLFENAEVTEVEVDSEDAAEEAADENEASATE